MEPVRLAPTPAYVLTRCQRSPLLRSACPHRLPYVGPQPAWDAQVCLHGKPGCLGLSWDDLELQHVDFGPAKPPTWAHIAVFAGRDLDRALPFRYRPGGKVRKVADGLFRRARSGPLSFGRRMWAGKTGTLVLAPGYPRGGEQADHLVFRWRQHGLDHAIGLHGWEPLSQAAATLAGIVDSTTVTLSSR